VGSNETLTWDFGYALGQPWAQGGGGDITICQNIKSIIPQFPAPQEFVLDGAGGYPGIVSYGSNFNFSSGNGTGSTLVSPPYNWIAHDTSATICTTDWYQYFANKFGLSSLAVDYNNPSSQLTYNNFRINNHVPVYRVQGNMQTQANWNVQNGDNTVIFVSGDLTINNNITINGRGFLAFIVNGSITVASSVGNPVAGNTNPNIQGLYITSSQPGANFITSPTTNAGNARLILKGIFIAHDFTLQRDLNQAVGGANLSTPAEQFIYDPMLLFTMPPEFEDIHVKWQEVAP